jgi:CshA-type fibril repeat protein
MKRKNSVFQMIGSLFIFIILFSTNIFAQIEFKNIDLNSNTNVTIKSSSAVMYKSGIQKQSIGDYVWFDYNQNGVQDKGEIGLGDVSVKLFDSADCSGSVLQETVTSTLGYYEFKDLLPSNKKYCIAVELPDYWEATKNQQISNGKIENITLDRNIKNVDIGMHHRNKNCQLPTLELGAIGENSYVESWGTKPWLDVKFNNFVAHGFCHEDNDVAPNVGDKYVVHYEDRRGFTELQHDQLSRVFRFASDPEVISLFDKTFNKTESYYWIEMFHNLAIWYITDWNYSIDKVDKVIDENSWFTNLSKQEKASLKEISHLIINKIEGKNGETQYAPMKVYYLWNETSDARQDIIVPETFLIPNRKECFNGDNPLLKVDLGDKVWFDTNKNGKQESTELGLKDVTVELYNTNDKLVRSTKTNAQGLYSFTNLDAGEYHVKFKNRAGYSFTKKDANGVDETLDSDADEQTGVTATIFLDRDNLNIDAGMYITPKPSISIDVTTNEGNVSNIIVGDTITWTYVVKNRGNEPLTNLVIIDNKVGQITDCVGSGSLDLLTPSQSITCTKIGTAILGNYSNTATVKATSTSDINVSSSDSSSYVGREATPQLGTVGDYVWLDNNKNGIQDGGELGLEGIDVKLYNKNSKLITSTRTDSSGKYYFSDVLAGEYYVKFQVPNAYSVTKKGQGADRRKDSDTNAQGKSILFTLVAGECNEAIDMGLYPANVNLGDRVWFDVNANGVQDSSETKGVAGVTVKLYKADKTFVAETKTTTSGQYLFRNLVPNSYYVVFEIPSNYKASPQLVGNNRSKDSDVNPTTGKTATFTLLAGIDNKTIDMGLFQESTKVGDRVFYDLNKNGLQDSGENGVGDVEVKLYRVGESDAVATTKTSASGIYLFDNIPAGEYYIIFTAPAGYTITEAGKGSANRDSNPDQNGRTQNFTLVAGTQDSSIDMGIYQNVVSLGDRVFLDSNHNGLQDVGEKGVRDVTVLLSSATSDFNKSMVTDENGNYLFTHLPAGEYNLEFKDIPYGFLITQKDVNENQNDQNDSDGFEKEGKIVTETALLTPGQNDLSWDLGIYKTVCLPGKSVIGNLVFEDFNKDGIQDIGERGVANVAVTLYNNDTDEKVAATKTDENGLYEFTHIDPNFNYYVQFSVPTGYKVSPQDQENDTIDSDADENGKTDVITVTADQINSSVDMGIYHQGATIGDRVFFDDLNGLSNGVQEVGEQGVNDVKVTLYSADGTLLKTTRTNASGEYHFTNVDKGRYVVGFSELPTGYIFTLKSQGTDLERDSDVNTNGRTDVIVVSGSEIITGIDAGLKKLLSGTSSRDIKRGVTGNEVTLDVLANDVEGSFHFDASTVRITTIPDGATLSEDGKTLTVPNEGVWRVNPDTGAITFTPASGFVGDPTPISYSVKDTEGNETGAEIEVTYPPLAVDDRVNAQVGEQVVIHILDNDKATSSPLDKTSIRLIDPSSGDEVENISVIGEGMWSTNIDGSITFTPDDGFKNNPTPIKYLVREVDGEVSNQATVTIIYPDAVDDTVVIPRGTTGATTVNVYENDSNNTIANTVTIGCNQAGVKTLLVENEGTWSVNDDGSITFTPIVGFTGEPTDIKYTVALVSGERSNCATVDFRQELLAVDDVSTLNVGGVSFVNVLPNDFGALNAQTVQLVIPTESLQGTTLSSDGRTLTVPSEGVWSVNDEGIITFTAQDGFVGVPHAIGYTVENNSGTRSNVATVRLTEGGVSVVANDDTGTVNGGNPVQIAVLNNDEGDLNSSSVRFIDANGNEVTSLVVPNEGTWTIANNGVVTFTGVSGYVGTPTPVRYIVYDRTAVLSDTATVRINGTCNCTPYETSIPAMGQLATILLVLFTTLIALLFFKEEEFYSVK